MDVSFANRAPRRGQIDNIIGDVIIVLYILYVLLKRIKLPLRVADCGRVCNSKKPGRNLYVYSRERISDCMFIRTFVPLVRHRLEFSVYASLVYNQTRAIDVVFEERSDEIGLCVGI